MNQQTARRLIFLGLGLLVFLFTACAGGPTPTQPPYLPPTRALPTETPTPAPLVIFTPAPELLPSATPSAAPAGSLPSPEAPCTNNLKFLADLTVPDGSVFAPGTEIDKRWQVENTGTCNWDARYRLRLFTGDLLGAAPEVSLYPALAGARAEIAIRFTAPAEPGVYRSEWQAYGPDGIPFGERIYMEIVVASP
ncbi:MAG: NBR1-Ig-like domain-containing protein [Anaerolineales bacterium]